MFWPNEGKIDTIIADPRDVRTEPRDSVPGSEAGGHLLRQSEGRDREGQSAVDCLCCNACCKQIRCRDEFIMNEKRIASETFSSSAHGIDFFNIAYSKNRGSFTSRFLKTRPANWLAENSVQNIGREKCTSSFSLEKVHYSFCESSLFTNLQKSIFLIAHSEQYLLFFRIKYAMFCRNAVRLWSTTSSTSQVRSSVGRTWCRWRWSCWT